MQDNETTRMWRLESEEACVYLKDLQGCLAGLIAREVKWLADNVTFRGGRYGVIPCLEAIEDAWKLTNWLIYGELCWLNRVARSHPILVVDESGFPSISSLLSDLTKLREDSDRYSVISVEAPLMQEFLEIVRRQNTSGEEPHFVPSRWVVESENSWFAPGVRQLMSNGSYTRPGVIGDGYMAKTYLRFAHPLTHTIATPFLIAKCCEVPREHLSKKYAEDEWEEEEMRLSSTEAWIVVSKKPLLSHQHVLHPSQNRMDRYDPAWGNVLTIILEELHTLPVQEDGRVNMGPTLHALQEFEKLCGRIAKLGVAPTFSTLHLLQENLEEWARRTRDLLGDTLFLTYAREALTDLLELKERKEGNQNVLRCAHIMKGKAWSGHA
ncbi:hypothetical protein A3D60_01235 [Candidatus Uhrbacteria bacterium RIFCSPHIGHO2_02_FULL_47_29]|uniref:Uncharacterized protein n=1 Tax=Candidatus Uhrbacteria bacterium RIFCSPLOWO2_01_FULL_47_25 TaxID=1802402 RepID=A0A1F7UTC5_9BACT|nr:MAG: hypothetical protein A2752_05215 [Candidatus Uhrbacteria bacterium RIFCSPHIGHO2_01_FULL_46_23]OGL67841.1 MAG: hypothetical protein A3D60_01235 [Candidatus Uhrbacteria bacterium RIFCSPHIGHO2_02_FULL_47_29]OGL81542.1 MAG: hypothetical protein A2936_01735 [Candidatus Uhrbacteria bacterium RIFCSPLOWO2_01_FULL_47_25]OGL85763.1 MAG: hypothetical protein A3I37_02675 [Candidatus Uhrbacteria bacterium RIFCSPLOWO2_02_FULL_46_19]